MENIRKRIQDLLKKHKIMRDIYRKYPKKNDSELLELFIAQEEIEKIKIEKPILKDALVGYWELYNFSPIEILEEIKYKTDSDIRIDFEKIKYIKGGIRGRKNFESEVGNSFKKGISSNDGGGDFSSYGRDLNF